MLEVSNLCKKYGFNEVLNNVSLTIEEPGLYVINGVNGSGKSTILKILSGMIYKTSGRVSKNLLISYLPDKFSMPKLMRVKAYLSLVLDKEHYFDIDKIMSTYQIPNVLIGSLSKGNLQKLGLIQALYNNSDLYIFDEPIDGLDDASKKIFKQGIKDKIEKGKIIVMALHNKTFFNDLHPITYTLKGGELIEKRKKD